MRIVMGAPNLLRGGSHSGNVSAAALAAEGLLDNLASDYVPASLLQAAFRLAAEPHGLSLPQAVAAVSATPAATRSEEHTSELQSLMRISYAVFCLKKKKQ